MASARIKELIEEISKLLPNNAEEIKGDFKDNLKILLNDYLGRSMLLLEKNSTFKHQSY